jgi:predicted HicB family RNase H-like nuclease
MRNLMQYNGYSAKVEYSDEDNCFFGVILGVNDSISFEGQSTAELNKAFKEVVDDYLDMCKRLAKEPDKTYKGSFNVRINPELHRQAALLAASSGLTLNKFIESAIDQRVHKYE